jgi:uncharacterized protein YciU (UPF0263 family)
MDKKKIRERKFINEVAQIYPAFPVGEIIDNESPDFLIKQNTQIIGVEIVDYVRGQIEGESVERRNEVLWQKVANTAKGLFETKHNIPLLIHFHWNKRHFLRQAEISRLANDFVRLVENHIPEKLFGNIRIGLDELEGTLLDDVCHSITITRVRNDKQSLWSFISSGWIEVQTNEIQYLIDAKNDKTQDYLRRCDETWLIIVADGHYISSNIDLPEATSNNVFVSFFEQVLVYDRISKIVYPLRLQRA